MDYFKKINLMGSGNLCNFRGFLNFCMFLLRQIMVKVQNSSKGYDKGLIE